MRADEVAEAHQQLKQHGDVLQFGVSNFSPSQLSLLQSRCDFPLVTNQLECSPYKMPALENGTLDQCQELDISPMFWSPLAGGKLFSRDDENIVLATGNIDRVSAATQSQLLTMNPVQWYRIWQSSTGHSVP